MRYEVNIKFEGRSYEDNLFTFNDRDEAFDFAETAKMRGKKIGSVSVQLLDDIKEVNA